MKTLEALINMGLNEKEAKAYLALLQLEKATAYTIASRSGLKKPTAHVVLDNLVSKGFALKIPYNRRHCYIAKSPRECLALAKEKISTAEEMLPELLAIRKVTEEKPNVSYYDGLEGIKEMYNRLIKVMRSKSENERSFVAFFAHQKDTPDCLQKYLKKSINELSENRIKRKAITTLHKSTQKYLEIETMNNLGLEIKALSGKEYSSNISIEVYENCTQIISHRYVQGILIENRDIANVMKQIFSLVWNLTEKKQ